MNKTNINEDVKNNIEVKYTNVNEIKREATPQETKKIIDLLNKVFDDDDIYYSVNEIILYKGNFHIDLKIRGSFYLSKYRIKKYEEEGLKFPHIFYSWEFKELRLCCLIRRDKTLCCGTSPE